MRSKLAATGGLLILSLAGGAAAEEHFGPHWTFGGGVGSFTPAGGDARLGRREGEFALFVDAGYRASRHLAWGVDYLFFSQEVDTPAGVAPPTFGTLDRRAGITGSGLSATAKWIVSSGMFGGDRLEGWLGGGLGIFRSTFRVTGQLFGFPGASEEKSNDIGLQLLVGASYRTAAGSLFGIEWRRLELDASFGQFVPGGKVALGGRSVLLTWRQALPAY